MTSSSSFKLFLILRGLLSYDILFLCLNKRWRIDYGVNNNLNRKIAVPYRAKDIPAERSEFGHPDVALLFTHLSYYYSGLDHK